MSEIIPVLNSKETIGLSATEFLAKCSAYGSICLDVGAGDGAFAYRHAKAHPEALVIGIDPARDQLQRFSFRATRKPTRGGLANVLYVITRLETLPECFAGLCLRVFVLYPWASLLHGIVTADRIMINQLVRVLKPQGLLEVVLNMYVFDQEDQCRRRGLPRLDEGYVLHHLAPELERASLRLKSHQFLQPGEALVASTWGGRLERGSKRQSLRMVFERG